MNYCIILKKTNFTTTTIITKNNNNINSYLMISCGKLDDRFSSNLYIFGDHVVVSRKIGF